MPLSEHEQRMLEQMERALYEEDPRFAATIRDTPVPGNRARRGAGLGVLVAALGVVAMASGLVMNFPLVSILGFVGLVAGTYMAIRGVAGAGRTATAQRAPKPANFMKSAEDRFRNRRDGGPSH
ncbi:MAG: DUF3040 domain-containing protein [Candidatus Nanopelagicales bacterium]